MKRVMIIVSLVALSLSLLPGCGQMLCHPTRTESQQNVDYRECDHIAAQAEAKGLDRSEAKDECMLKRGYVRVSPFNKGGCKRTKEVE
ncbi:MAG: hypothetical protein V3573_13185 [Desulfovibrionaceae bacterium]